MPSVNAVLGTVLIWYVGVIVLLWKVRQDGDAAACLASQRLITVLEYVPYELRADALKSVVPTIDTYYNVQIEFFETDWRVTNKFTIEVLDERTIQGESNWVGYKVKFVEPATYDFSCLMSIGDFRFL